VVFAFRRLATTDLVLLHRWLNEPGVVEWWEGDDVSWEAILRDYDPASPDSTEHWIATCDGVDVGWIQCYPATDDPDETELWFSFGVDRTAAGIDYLIGDPAQRGLGLGTEMIRAFVVDVVFGLHPTWSQACAGPFAANTASWRALERAGFRRVGVIDDPDGACNLMVIDRPDVASGDANRVGG
jgi:aminoglycoside 6'-N-acetyltransferase